MRGISLVENLAPDEVRGFYDTYTLTEVPEASRYFQAPWRRSNPLPYMEDHTPVGRSAGSGTM